MELFQILGNASIVARLSMLVAIFPLGAGLAYALRPSEQRLAMMRPISLAGLFSALAGAVVGAINVLRGIWMAEGVVDWKNVAVGSARRRWIPAKIPADSAGCGRERMARRSELTRRYAVH